MVMNPLLPISFLSAWRAISRFGYGAYLFEHKVSAELLLLARPNHGRYHLSLGLNRFSGLGLLRFGFGRLNWYRTQFFRC